MKEIKTDSGSIYVCSLYFRKIVEHCNSMNLWKYNPDFIRDYPDLQYKVFTLQDALQDLLMKGGL